MFNTPLSPTIVFLPVWGGRGRGFKSRRSDHITIFIGLESFANTIRGALFFIATMPPATDYRSILRAAAPCQHKPKRNPHGKKGRPANEEIQYTDCRSTAGGQKLFPTAGKQPYRGRHTQYINEQKVCTGNIHQCLQIKGKAIAQQQHEQRYGQKSQQRPMRRLKARMQHGKKAGQAAFSRLRIACG